MKELDEKLEKEVNGGEGIFPFVPFPDVDYEYFVAHKGALINCNDACNHIEEKLLAAAHNGTEYISAQLSEVKRLAVRTPLGDVCDYYYKYTFHNPNGGLCSIYSYDFDLYKEI